VDVFADEVFEWWWRCGGDRLPPQIGSACDVSRVVEVIDKLGTELGFAGSGGTCDEVGVG